MNLSQWIKTLSDKNLQKTPQRTRDRRRSPLLSLEALEDRCVPSAVSNMNDSGPGSLRDAIVNSTAAGGIVTFNLTGRNTITLTSGAITIAKNLTITGPGASSLTIDGDANGAVFIVNNGVTDSISGLTIQNGKAAGNGGGILNNGTLTLQGDTVTKNTASGAGGGIENTGTLTVTNSTITSNTATNQSGGGIDNNAGATVTITGSTVGSNTAADGFGGGLASDGALTINGSTFTGNTAGFGAGGGIFENTTLGVTNSIGSTTVTLNSSTTTDGGGIENGTDTLTINNSTITKNTAAGPGGGIENTGTLTVSSSTIDSNNAAGGGGVSVDGGTVVMTGSTISNNKAFASGGISVSIGSFTLINSTVSGNQATITTDATAATAGGLVVVTSGSAGNASVTLTQDTFGNNTAASAADAKDLGVFQSGTGLASATLANTILGSTATFNPNAVATGGGTITSHGGNLSFDGTGVATPTDLKGDPLLGALQNNGGPTFTQALLANSPAIGKGGPNANITTDQRGFPVPSGAALDIGAYQIVTSFVVTTLADEDNGSPDPSLGTGTSLREAINADDANPGGGTITFKSGLTGTIKLTLGALPALTNNLTITGPGAAALAIDGNANGRVFSVNSGATDTISGLTIQNGNVTGNGGGILNNGSLTLQNDTVTKNTASGAGDSGGGLASFGPLTITGSTFTGNTAGGSGGGILENTILSATNSIGSTTVTLNNATTSGGGVYYSGDTPLTITSSTLTKNTTAGIGGGIEALGLLLTVTNTTIDSNTAGTGGGGVSGAGGTAVITGSTISNNQAASAGGINVYGSSLTLINSTVSGNQATSTTDGNATTAGGLAEQAGGSGNYYYVSVTLTQDTFGNNTAASAADAKDFFGAYFITSLDSESVVLGNTILGSTATTNPNVVSLGIDIFSSGHNLSFDGTGATAATDLKGDPLLGPLQNNGGPTFTMAPAGNSPVLNKGSVNLAVDQNGKALTTDQTGGPRIIDGTVDIGAVEAPVSIDTIQFQVSSVGINENAATLTVTVVRTGGSYNAVTATLGAGGTATGDTAVSGVDYAGLPQTVNFASGATSASFNVTILNPTTAAAGAKTLTLTLSSPTGATIGAPATEAVTITDNGPVGGGTGNGLNGVLAFSSATYSATEASGTVTLTITRTNGTTGAVAVQYFVSAATSLAAKYQATPSTDFTGNMSGTLNFGAGVMSQTITFTIPNPGLVEENTEFLVILSQPTGGATLGSQATATVTIVDTDLPTVPNATPSAATLIAAGLGFGTSTEHYQHFVLSAYATYLQRVPSATELAYWVNLMQEYEANHATGLRQQDIEAGFLDSAEYLSRNGGSPNKAWIDSIYQNLLGRAPDPNGEAYWLGQLTLGVNPQTVAEGFTDSQERLSDRVTATYQTLLGRLPDANGLAYWINIFNTGGTTEDINSGFVGSAEYYAKTNGALGGGSAGNPAEWIREAYLDVLGRAAQVSEMTYWLSFLKQPS